MRAAQARIGLDQERLAARMRALGQTAWRRQTVARVQQSQRRLTAEEVLDLALALETTMASLLAATGDDKDIEFPTGVLDVESIQASAMGYNTEPVRWDGDVPVFSTAEPARLRHIRDQMPWRFYDKRAHQAVFPVVAAIVTSHKGVLIGRRNDGTPPWTFIAGEQEPGEDRADTVIREVKEETGLDIRPGEVIGERDHPATGRRMIYMAARPAGRRTSVFVGDEAELAEVRWVSLAEAEELLTGMYEPVREYLTRTLKG